MTVNTASLEQVDSAILKRDFPRAESLLAIINSDPAQRTLHSLLRQGHVLEAQEKLSGAVDTFKLAEQYAIQRIDKVKLLNRMSDLLYLQHKERISKDKLTEMAEILERSVELDATPLNVGTIIKLCNIYQTIKNVTGLVAHAERLKAFPGYFPESQLWLATANFQLGHKKQGLSNLAQVEYSLADLNNHHLFWLLRLLVQYRNFESAQTVLDHCRENHLDGESVLELQAQVFFENRNFQAVLQITTDDAVTSCKSPAITRRLHYYRAKSLEENSDYSKAHGEFIKMNRIAQRTYCQTNETDPVRAYRGATYDNLQLPADDQPLSYQLVFMIAFPRSGTTLLETILDTQPEILTLSEVDAVTEVRQKMEKSGSRYPEDLPALTREDISRLRDAYTAHVDEYLRKSETCTTVIDKLPLNIIHVPLIKKLFPNARFILSLRHPMDVCLSCFQQDFLLNNEMAFFTTLEGCFTRYRDVMDIFQQHRDNLSLDLHIVRYEDLVDDLEKTATEIFQFLGIEPDESYQQFHTINEDKLIATPSRSQVVRPLYESSRYRWTHYAKYLRPYMHHIQPYLEMYDYPLE